MFTKRFFLLALLTLMFLSTLSAQAQCTSGCNQSLTISGNTNTNITVSANNNVICLTGSGTYQGTINVNNKSGVTICVGPDVNFKHNAGIQNPSGTFTINNYGTFDYNLTLNSNQTFNNYGSYTGGNAGGGITLNGGSFNNTGTFNTGSMTFNSGTVNNTGTFTMTGTMQPNSGSTFTGGGTVTLGGYNQNGGNITFGGTTTINGNATVNGGTLTLGGNTTINGNLTNQSGATIAISGGSLNVTGTVNNSGTINAPASATGCNSFCATGTVTNGGTISGSSPATLNLCKTVSGTSGSTTVTTPPAGQPSSLSLSITGGIVSGSYTAASPAPSSYLVIRKIGSNFVTADQPEYGTAYNIGDIIGSAEVVAKPSGTSFTDIVDQCGNYYYAIYSVNSIAGSCGTAAYNTTTPLTNGSVLSANARSAAFTYANSSYCQAATDPSATITGSDVASTFSASPAGLVFLNTATGLIDASASTVGSYTITRSIAASNGCAASSSTFGLSIVASASATISYPSASYCTSTGGNISVNRTGTAGGTYSVSPAGLTINASTGAITPSSSSAGSYTVTYTVTSGGCSDFTTTASVSITAANSATISYSVGTFCTSSSTQTVTRTGTAGGTYTVSPSGLTINSSTGTITPSSSSAGTYTVTYTMAANGPCGSATATTTVTIGTPTYTWNGSVNSNYSTAANWTPARNLAQACDELTINSNVTLASITTQSISRLTIGSNATVSLNPGSSTTLTVTSTTGNAISVAAGCTLTLNTSNMTLRANTGTTMALKGRLNMTNGVLNISGASLVVSSTSGSYAPFARTSGTVTVNTSTNLQFGAAGETSMANLTIPNSFFTSAPSINNFTLMTSTANVSLGNQDLTINGTFARPSGNGVLVMNGRKLTLAGTLSGTPTVNGNSASSHLEIGGTGNLNTLNFSGGDPTLYQLTINRTNVDTTLMPYSSDVTLMSQMVFTKGVLKSTQYKFTVTGSMSNESDNSNVVGKIQVTKTINANVSENFNNLGITIIAYGASPGVTTVTRETINRTVGDAGSGIRRKFTITPTVNTGLNATITIKLLNTEKYTLNFNSLVMYRSTDGGSSWAQRGFTSRDGGNNTVSLSGINQFSDWTLGGEDAPLPVEISSYYATSNQNGTGEFVFTVLNEINNRGFMIQRSYNGNDWETVKYIDGRGNANSAKQYRTDISFTGSKALFRVVQEDFDGVTKNYAAVMVTNDAVNNFNIKAYPNPATDNLHISYHSIIDSDAKVEIFNSTGKVVMESDESVMRGSAVNVMNISALQPGVYVLRATLTKTGESLTQRIVKQ